MFAANVTQRYRILPQLAHQIFMPDWSGWNLGHWLEHWSNCDSGGYDDYACNDPGSWGLSLHL